MKKNHEQCSINNENHENHECVDQVDQIELYNKSIELENSMHYRDVENQLISINIETGKLYELSVDLESLGYIDTVKLIKIAIKEIANSLAIEPSYRLLVTAQNISYHMTHISLVDIEPNSKQYIKRSIELSYFLLNKMNYLDKITVKLSYPRSLNIDLFHTKLIAKEPTHIAGSYLTFKEPLFTTKTISSKLNKKAINIMQSTPLYYKKLPKKLDLSPLQTTKEPTLSTKLPYYFKYKSDGCRTYPIGYLLNPQGDNYRKASILNQEPKKLTDEGLKWLYIDIANCYDYDKLSFKKRTKIGKAIFNYHKQLTNSQILKSILNSRKCTNKSQAYKIITELKEPPKYRNFNSLIGLDATFSGGQILGILSRCFRTCYHTNITSLTRQDTYTNHNKIMNQLTKEKYTRKQTKKALMTHFYLSKRTPKSTFKNHYNTFLKSIKELLPGAELAKELLHKCWLNINHKDHIDINIWEYKLRYELRSLKRISWHYKNLKLTHNIYITEPNPNYKGFVARVVHFIDGIIALKMIEMAHKQDFIVVHNHDKFFTHPNNVNQMRENYKTIIKELYKADILTQICSQCGVNPSKINDLKLSDIKCIYAIS